MTTTPRTDAQRTASRLNGALSKGPLTAEGRHASSRNATKHGLTGSGKHLPPDMAAELLSEIAIFATKYRPRDDYERDLIRRAALGTLRARRISETLNALSDERMRNATRLWDDARASEIKSLAGQLLPHPETAVAGLLRTAEGCDHLADSWDSLAHALSTAGTWTPSESRLALSLLGLQAPPSPDHPHSAFWTCVLALGHADIPNAPTPSEALTLLLDFIADRVSALESEGARLWEIYDLPSRQSASARSAFEGGTETARLERYLAAAERLRRQSLDELHRLRRDEAKSPAPDEPAHQSPSAQNMAAEALLSIPADDDPAADRPPVQDEPELPTRSQARRLALLLDRAPQTSSSVAFAIGRRS